MCAIFSTPGRALTPSRYTYLIDTKKSAIQNILFDSNVCGFDTRFLSFLPRENRPARNAPASKRTEYGVNARAHTHIHPVSTPHHWMTRPPMTGRPRSITSRRGIIDAADARNGVALPPPPPSPPRVRARIEGAPDSVVRLPSRVSPTTPRPFRVH